MAKFSVDQTPRFANFLPLQFFQINLPVTVDDVRGTNEIALHGATVNQINSQSQVIQVTDPITCNRMNLYWCLYVSNR